jgi:4,5-DOPA dioxygenase extradiol
VGCCGWGKERENKLNGLSFKSDIRGAHPTFEHLLPIFVGASEAGGDKGVRLWTKAEGSFSWAQLRFGEVPA